MELEPPYRPFFHFVGPIGPVHDDARKHTMLSAFVERLLGNPAAMPQPSPVVFEIPEPEPEADASDSLLVEIQVSVPPGLKVTREAAEHLVAARYRWRLVSFDPASGDGSDAEAAVLSRLSSDGGRAPVLLLAEAWEPPSKNLLHFVGTLRARVGPERAIVVGLLTRGASRTGSDVDDVRIWRRRVAALGDPRLRVEAFDA